MLEVLKYKSRHYDYISKQHFSTRKTRTLFLRYTLGLEIGVSREARVTCKTGSSKISIS